MNEETRTTNNLGRIILAGGPSCGKTSIVKELRKRGYTTIDEAAREVIEERKLVPGTLEFQLEIFRRQKDRNSGRFFHCKGDRDSGNFLL